MKDTVWMECEECGGEAEFTREHVPFCDPGDWKRLSHDCDPACKNHPDTDPTALTRQLEEEETRRSEANFERTLSGDHGPLPLSVQAERARKLK